MPFKNWNISNDIYIHGSYSTHRTVFTNTIGTGDVCKYYYRNNFCQLMDFFLIKVDKNSNSDIEVYYETREYNRDFTYKGLISSEGYMYIYWYSYNSELKII